MLLISEPFLEDPNFDRSVVYVCEHNEEGTVGFILNKETEYSLGDISEVIDANDYPVYMGGPVEQDTMHFLHNNINDVEGTLEVVHGVFWGGNFEQVKLFIQSGIINKNDVRFFVGYSGWAQGQLQEELDAGSWMVAQIPTDVIFQENAENMWREVLKGLGGKFKVISNFPEDPRLN